jgi:cytochrome P450
MPFFDPARAAYRADPYPFLARLRREAPVFWSPELRSWVLTRYGECADVLRDNQRFTMDPARTTGTRAEAILAHRAAAPLGDAPSLGTTSGTAHRQLRRIVNPLFAPAATEARRADIIEACEVLACELPRGVPVDVMGAVANPLPQRVMAAVMGYPPGEAETMQGMLAVVQVARSNPLAGAAVNGAAEAAVTDLRSRFCSPSSDRFAPDTVLGALTRQGMQANDAVSLAAHVATVGSDPTSGAIGNSLAALATHPEAWTTLRADRARLRGSVHELLRYDSPTHIAPRFAADDAELGGRRVRRGDSLLAVVGAANRDPEAFDRPDELDLGRDARRQLGFGQGEHICLGASLALVIVEAMLGVLLERFEQVELVAPPQPGRSIELRIPDQVVVRFS